MPYLIYFTTLLIPTYVIRISSGPIHTNVFEIALLITFIIGFSLAIFQKIRNGRPIRWGDRWPYLLILAAAISMIYAPCHSVALGILKSWFIAPIAYYWLIINYLKRPQAINLIYCLIIGLLLVCLWGALQFLGIHHLFSYQTTNPDLVDFLSNGPRRIFSIFESPNYLAMYVLPLIFLGLLATFNSKRWVAIAIWPVLALAVAVLMLTESRAGAIGFLMAISLILLLEARAKKSYIFTCLSVLLVIFFGLIIVRDAYNPDRYLSNRWRGKIYHYSYIMVKQEPILGVGLGGYQTKLAQTAKNDQEFLVYGLPYAYHPHDLYLAFWLNLGLLGLIVFIGVLVSYTLRVVRSNLSPFEKAVLLAAMVTILIHGIFDTPYFKNDLSAIFWILYALPFVLTQENPPRLTEESV